MAGLRHPHELLGVAVGEHDRLFEGEGILGPLEEVAGPPGEHVELVGRIADEQVAGPEALDDREAAR